MKIFIILFCGLVLAKGVEVEKRDPLEKDVEELLITLMKEYFELKNLIDEVKLYQQTQKMSSQVLAERIASLPSHCLPTDTTFIEAWDTDPCQKLQATLKKGLDLGENITNWALEAGLTIAKELYHLICCGNVNPVTAIKCIVNTIDDIKDTIYAYKPFILKFKNEIVVLVQELKTEFKQCFGIQNKAQAIAEQIVVQAQLCNKMKPLEQP